METKICTKCKETKPYNLFSRCTEHSTGRASACKSCYKIQYKKYIKENKEYVSERRKRNYQKTRKACIQMVAKYQKNKMSTNPLYKLSHNVRCLIRNSFKLKRFKKNSKTEQILGCSFEEFKKHIEKQFKEGMSWDNRSKWHIDHIIPLATAKTEIDVIKLNHYANLQPLWAEDNLKKGSKI